MKEVMLRGKAVRLVTQLYGGGCKFAFGRTDSLFLCAALRTSSSTMYKGHQQHFQRAHGNNWPLRGVHALADHHA